MAKYAFTTAEWKKINQLVETSAEKFGLPKRRSKSIVLGTFNIRKLGDVKKRSKQAWDFLQLISQRFDLLAIQEVMDNLEGIRELHNRLGKKYGLVVSDVTGVFPGEKGVAERLAFLFHWPRIERSELASDITYDRSKIVQTLLTNHVDFEDTWEKHLKALVAWKRKAVKNKAVGKRAPAKPTVELPKFLTFIRQPHCVSFKVLGKGSAKPHELLVVNAHLLYGKNKLERKWEFDSLIEWLTVRAKKADMLYHKNFLLMGDCNLEFESTGIKRDEVDAQLKAINKTRLKSKRAAKANFPLLSDHPKEGRLTTNIRLNQTYDQIALFSHDKRLPTYEANITAGSNGVNAYDYGVFNYSELFSQALYGKRFDDLTKAQRKEIIKKSEHDISDHMPAWIRLPIPGA